MKILISILLCVIILVVLYYLAFITKLDVPVESFVTGTTGISSVCNLATDPTNYNNPAICFDISYNDATTGLPVQVRAKIQDGYYIDASGYLEVVPYGNIASADKLSYNPKTQTSSYETAVITDQNKKLDAQIAQIQQQIAATPTPAAFTLNGLQQKLANLQQQKISLIDTSSTSNSNYNSDNFDITYHADPTKQTQPDGSTAGVGQMWVDISGTLVAIPYSDVSNTTLYYSSGDYIYNSASYVPNYEETVYLSSLTNQPTTSIVHNLADTQSGFCSATQSSVLEREAKCNALDKNVCGSTDCCVLLGGEKCVAGNQNGPSIKSNYSDTTIFNRDFYYYRGDCFGHCP
jgi:hypothetical protein